MKSLNTLLVGNSSCNTSDPHSKKKKKSSVPWHWKPVQQEAFNTLKEKLSSPPILAYADFKKLFILHTDVSTDGLSEGLYQEQDGLERVIANAIRG